MSPVCVCCHQRGCWDDRLGEVFAVLRTLLLSLREPNAVWVQETSEPDVTTDSAG